MEKFVERRNIARFTTLLMTETDTAKRELLQKLLTDEMVRQANLVLSGSALLPVTWSIIAAISRSPRRLRLNVVTFLGCP